MTDERPEPGLRQAQPASPPEPVEGHRESPSPGHNPNRQAVHHCPYCAEETLFPREGAGWECHSCLRAFSVAFLGLVSRERVGR